MSEYLARPWLNRFYLAILVTNCWLGPLLHSVFRDHKMKRRAMALVFDGILDLLTAIGVSAMIMLSFYKDYDFELGGFPAEMWYDDKCAHVGKMAQVAQEWEALDPMYIRRILVTHCPALEVPPELQGFSNMIGIKMYNTTISRWEADAAITGTHHPNLIVVVLGRVNTTSKTLPPGLLSPDFPSQLTDISLSYSNLEAFPDEVATRWPPSYGLGCEVCQITSLPNSTFQSQGPGWIALAKNPIAAFPVEAFAIASLQIIHLGGISFPSYQLPDANVVATTALTQIYLMGSNMTYLPKWVDVYLAKPRTQWYVAPLDLSMTPFCDALAELRAGTRSQFPEEWTRGVPTDQISNYMFLRSENVTALDGLIECSSQWIIYFPTADEDRRYGL
ncbi:hypothetical protein ATCC90586_000240 [Pythium insidiosum]|nr:hypothetical protein ATCC90586_000240 [Pythium insidiosum]